MAQMNELDPSSQGFSDPLQCSSSRANRPPLYPTDVALVDSALLGQLDLSHSESFSQLHNLHGDVVSLLEDLPLSLSSLAKPCAAPSGHIAASRGHLSTSIQHHMGFYPYRQ